MMGFHVSVRSFAVFCVLSHSLSTTNSQVVLSLEIGGCNLTFSKTAILSLQECLCSGNPQSCFVLFKYSYWRSGYQALGSVSSGYEKNRGDSNFPRYICEATCTQNMFSYRLRSFSCSYALSSMTTSPCKDGTKCNLYTGVTSFVKCGNKCIDICWSKSEQVIVSVRDKTIAGVGLCENETAGVGLCENETTGAATASAAFRKSTISVTTLSIPVSSEPDTFLSTTDSEISSRNVVMLSSLTVIGGVAIITGLVFFVLCTRGRLKPGHTLQSRHGYITPVDVPYSSSLLADERHNNLGYCVVSDGCNRQFRTDTTKGNSLNSQSEYSECTFDNSLNCMEVNKPELIQISSNRCSQNHADESGLLLETNRSTDLSNVYSELTEPFRNVKVPHYINAINSFDVREINISPQVEQMTRSLTSQAEEDCSTNRDVTYSTISDLTCPETNDLGYTTITDSTYSNTMDVYIREHNQILPNLVNSADNSSSTTGAALSTAVSAEDRSSNRSKIPSGKPGTSWVGKTKVGCADQKLVKSPSLLVYSRLGEHDLHVINEYDVLSNVEGEFNSTSDNSSALNYKSVDSDAIYPFQEIQNFSEHLDVYPYCNNDIAVHTSENYTSGTDFGDHTENNGIYSNESAVYDKKSKYDSQYKNYIDFTSKHDSHNSSQNGTNNSTPSSVSAYSNVNPTSTCNTEGTLGNIEHENIYVEMTNPFSRI